MSHVTVHRHDRGMTTAEYAIGVVAAVCIAALLLAFVLDGFFDELLGSLFQRILDVVRTVFSAGAGAWSLSDIAAGAWSTLAGAATTTGWWAWDAASAAAGHSLSGASSLVSSTWSGLSAAGSAALDVATDALRWVGGPVSEVVR